MIHAAVFLFGFPGLFGKWLPLSPPLIVLGRVVFAGIALAAVLILLRAGFRITPSRDIGLLILCGVVLAAHWTSFFESIQVSSVAVGLLSYSSFPVFTAFLEPLVLKERLSGRSILLACACVFGVFLIVPQFRLADKVFQGVLWGLVSGLTFSILTIINRTLSRRHSSLIIAFYQDTFAALSLLPFWFLTKPVIDLRTAGLLLMLGVFCTAGAHTLFIQGMRTVKAQTASIISSLEPVYGILLAVVFLKEIPAMKTIIGGLVILLAAVSASIGHEAPPAEPEPGRPH